MWFPELQRIVYSHKERREKVSWTEEKTAIFEQWSTLSSDKKLSFSTQKSGSAWRRHKSSMKQKPLRCYFCDSINHLACDCCAHKSESQSKKIGAQK